MLIYRNHITRGMLKEEPEKLFVFGDNFAREGLGGQAAEMRGELNAVGIPTKVSPGISTLDYLNDGDLGEWLDKSSHAIARLMIHEGDIVWPSDGIGTGRAKLREKAPRIMEAINRLVKTLGG